MYYFLAMLETTDFRTMQTTIPIVLCVLWMNHRTISHGACFLQAYFIHSLPITESEILFAVSCDWFIAICHPLQCTSILNNTQVIKIGSGVFMRGFISICPNIASLLVFLLLIWKLRGSFLMPDFLRKVEWIYFIERALFAQTIEACKTPS